MILLACALYFFSVMVSESWHGGPWQFQGGWTHDGPHRTLTDCENARKRVAVPYVDSGHTVRYEPGPCRVVDFETYVRESQRLK